MKRSRLAAATTRFSANCTRLRKQCTIATLSCEHSMRTVTTHTHLRMRLPGTLARMGERAYRSWTGQPASLSHTYTHTHSKAMITGTSIPTQVISEVNLLMTICTRLCVFGSRERHRVQARMMTTSQPQRKQRWTSIQLQANPCSPHRICTLLLFHSCRRKQCAAGYMGCQHKHLQAQRTHEASKACSLTYDNRISTCTCVEMHYRSL
jgi:hypothetical protein